MTREERLKLLKQIEKDIHVCSIESTFLDDAKSCAIHSAIEELEQEPILDKIRAEIEQKIVKRHGLNHTRSERDRNDAFLEVLDIIDKHKAEREEK